MPGAAVLSPALALLAWPVVALVLFERLPLQRAIIWSVMGSFVFLPSAFAIDLPGMPALDKESLPNLVMLLVLLAKSQVRFRSAPPVALLLFGLMLLGGFGTVMVNPDTVWSAKGQIPGLSAYDAFSGAVRATFKALPFFVGWRYFGSVSSHRLILEVMFKLGMFYSLLMLFEVRMSPQLHTWVYGYFPHSFAQQIRFEGYRPVVFFVHGLWASFYAMSILLSAAALWKDAKHVRTYMPFGSRELLLVAVAYMSVVVVLCKSVGSIAQSAVLLPLVLLAKPRLQLAAATCMVALAISYPITRGAGIVPTDALLELASSVSEERAQSLGFRFHHEQMLLERGQQKPIFGWGGWGRSRVYDQETGEDLSVTDGMWVIIIGSQGWVGYVAIFGMLGVPVLMLRRRLSKQGAGVSHATACLAVLVGVNMIELIPNSTMPPWLWLFSGALLAARAEPYTRAAGSHADARRARL